MKIKTKVLARSVFVGCLAACTVYCTMISGLSLWFHGDLRIVQTLSWWQTTVFLVGVVPALVMVAAVIVVITIRVDEHINRTS